MNTDDAFLTPRFTGGRFENHHIPLDILKDLSVLEEFLVEVAKHCYRQDNPNRTRIPRGFTDSVSFGLSGIHQGSVVATVSVLQPPGQLFSPLLQYFEMARDRILEVILAGSSEKIAQIPIPPELMSYFNRFGRSLQDDESIDFSRPAGNKPVRLTRTVRRRLLLNASGTITEETVIRGTIPEFDQEKNTFEIQLANGSRVRAPVEDQYRAEIMAAFNNYSRNQKIALQGVGSYDHANRIQKMESVQHVSLLDPLDIGARSDELKLLKNGWLDGEGFAPDPHGIDWFVGVLQNSLPETVSFPHLYPTAEGGLLAEWTVDRQAISLDVDLRNRSGEWHELNLDTDQDLERELDLQSAEDWLWISGRLATGDPTE
ncbi:MAG: hypothetical protein EA427_11410 [Spirochaetaceae bacterium]|nr:MAG: hypothetical protein EA427_11410 [Spirochaetaceae bacterium]